MARHYLLDCFTPFAMNPSEAQDTARTQSAGDTRASSACSNGSSPQATQVLESLSLRASASDAWQSSKIISAPNGALSCLCSNKKRGDAPFFILLLVRQILSCDRPDPF